MINTPLPTPEILDSKYDYLKHSSSWLGRAVKGLFRLHCRFVMRWYCPLTIEGQENLPEGQSYILCSNHNSHMDSAVLMLATGKSFRQCAMVAAKDYFFDHKVRKFFLTAMMNLIPLDRSRKAGRKALHTYFAACALFCQQPGRVIIVYPEGTRSRTGQMQPFKKGPGMLSLNTGLALVPAYIEGTFKRWPKGNFWIRPGRLHVRIGKPIASEMFYQPTSPEDRPSTQAYQKVTAELEQRIHDLKGNQTT
jgi:1-acyl-sn-glycerol-3-phosphate acyltransferase